MRRRLQQPQSGFQSVAVVKIPSRVDSSADLFNEATFGYIVEQTQRYAEQVIEFKDMDALACMELTRHSVRNGSKVGIHHAPARHKCQLSDAITSHLRRGSLEIRKCQWPVFDFNGKAKPTITEMALKVRNRTCREIGCIDRIRRHLVEQPKCAADQHKECGHDYLKALAPRSLGKKNVDHLFDRRGAHPVWDFVLHL